jgi:PEGA domain
MRVVLTAFLAIALPIAAAAQSKGSARGSSRGHSPAVAPWSSMTSTLPPIGLGLPPIGLAPPSKPPFKGFGARFDRFDGRRRFDFRKNLPVSVVYVLPPFYGDFFAPYYAPTPGVMPVEVSAPPSPPPPPPAPTPASGWLRLNLEGAPSRAQVFVDGYFVGTLEDASSQIMLEAGPRAIEIRAPGYRSLEFDVKVVADRSITYQGALERLDGVVKPAEPPAAPSTIYFIPNCYLGNVPPRQAALPASCDIGKLSTYKP